MEKNVKVRVEIREFVTKVYNMPEREIPSFKAYISRHYGTNTRFIIKGRTLYPDNFRPWIYKKF